MRNQKNALLPIYLEKLPIILKLHFIAKNPLNAKNFYFPKIIIE
jgi:hypothetical protein